MLVSGLGGLEFTLLLSIPLLTFGFRKLPALRHLVISHFSAEDFNDRTLQAVPALDSLRLERLPGVTDKGLSRFAGSTAATTLSRLSLVNLEITSLTVLSKFLANLNKLQRFTLVQDTPPGILPGVVAPRPRFASSSLQYLHWDVLTPGLSIYDLAESIEAGAMPSLRTIRALSDPDGLLQALCRPLAEVRIHQFRSA